MTRKQASHDPVPMLEWIAAAVGLAIALLIIGTIGWEAVSGQDDPVPVLAVQAKAITPAGDNFVVSLAVTNASSRTAATVQVEGVLGPGSADEETSSATIDYVPGHGAGKGALIFTADPRTMPLVLRVTGYEHP